MPYRRKMKSAQKAAVKRRSYKRVPRGGFTLPAGSKGTAFLQSQLRKHILDPSKLGDAGYAMDRVNKLYSVAHKIPSIINGATKAGIVKTAGDVGRTLGFDKIAHIETSRSRGKRVGPQELKWHYTNLSFGRPSTKTLKRISMNNGTTMKWLKNTYNEATSIGLDIDFGFNQKHVCVFNENTQSIMDDYNDLFSMNDNMWPATTIQRVYGSILKECYEMKFSNTSSYFPVVVAVDYYRPHTDTRTPVNYFNDAFNTSNTSQEDGRVPTFRQSSGISGVGGRNSVFCDPTLRMEASSTFRSRTTKIKTVKQTLQPGEVWTLKWDVHCGAGVDLQRAYDQYLLGFNRVAGIMPVFSFHGKDCELRTVADGSTNIGTSPGYVSVEQKKGFQYVNAPVDITPNATNQGYLPGQPLIRVFTSDLQFTVDKTLFTVNANQIGDPASKPHYCPVMSDMVPSFAKEQTGT